VSGDSVVIALAGDAMLGRGVAERFAGGRLPQLVSAEVTTAIQAADLFILNLECCISGRGARWASPDKPFFFRAPPQAAELLAVLAVDCVTVANNHALDYGAEALLDTLDHLSAVGIRTAGAGADVGSARKAAILEAGGFRLAVVAATDHPAEFAAADDRPGVAYADLHAGETRWILDAIAEARSGADAVLFSPHWGPNLRGEPVPHVRCSGAQVGPRVTFVAGHSAHVFQGVGANVLFDLGDFLNDFASARPPRTLLAGVADKLQKEVAALREDAGGNGQSFGLLSRRRLYQIRRMIRARQLRSDLGMLFFVTLDRRGPRRLEALPIKIGRCYTDVAAGADAAFAHRRFRRACRSLGTEVAEIDGRSVVTWR
jgi:poly-gamma-glutamate synthesis protein (capsule biosynthesis protein)